MVDVSESPKESKEKSAPPQTVLSRGLCNITEPYCNVGGSRQSRNDGMMC